MADSNSKQWDAETIERELERGLTPMAIPRLPPFAHLSSQIEKCRHCEIGYRHIVGNCVACGCGPAPGKIDPLPTTDGEKQSAVARLFEAAGKKPGEA